MHPTVSFWPHPAAPEEGLGDVFLSGKALWPCNCSEGPLAGRALWCPEPGRTCSAGVVDGCPPPQALCCTWTGPFLCPRDSVTSPWHLPLICMVIRGVQEDGEARRPQGSAVVRSLRSVQAGQEPGLPSPACLQYAPPCILKVVALLGYEVLSPLCPLPWALLPSENEGESGKPNLPK